MPGLPAAFSLVEMMVVLAIIGVLAAVVAPSLKGLGRGTGLGAGARQLLDDLGAARQFAIKNRTMVYFLFAPPSSGYPRANSQFYERFKGDVLDPFVRQRQGTLEAEIVRRAFEAVVAGQYTTYAVYADRRVGDQPGSPRPTYLVNWRTLPQGIVFPAALFDRNGGITYNRSTNNGIVQRTSRPLLNPLTKVQFPAVVDVPQAYLTLRADLPGFAFDPNGQLRIVNNQNQLVLAPEDVAIALGEGSVIVPKKNGEYDVTASAQDILVETPPGNHTNTVILISPLSGRARVHRPPNYFPQ